MNYDTYLVVADKRKDAKSSVHVCIMDPNVS